MRKTLLSLAALAALGLASAPAMAADHGMKENAGKSMNDGMKNHDKAGKDTKDKRDGMEREGKAGKDKAEKKARKDMEEMGEGKREKEGRARERMEEETGY